MSAIRCKLDDDLVFHQFPDVVSSWLGECASERQIFTSEFGSIRRHARVCPMIVVNLCYGSSKCTQSFKRKTRSGVSSTYIAPSGWLIQAIHESLVVWSAHFFSLQFSRFLVGGRYTSVNRKNQLVSGFHGLLCSADANFCHLNTAVTATSYKCSGNVLSTPTPSKPSLRGPAAGKRSSRDLTRNAHEKKWLIADKQSNLENCLQQISTISNQTRNWPGRSHLS